MKEVVLTPEARSELREAIRFYQARDPRVATDFLVEIGGVLERMSENPAQFPVWEEDPAFRKAVLPATFRFVIYFHELADLIEVAAVSHGAREPGYWRRRE